MSITRKLSRVILQDNGSGDTTWNSGLSVSIKTVGGALVANATESPNGVYTAQWTAFEGYGYWYIGSTMRDDWGKVWLGEVAGNVNLENQMKVNGALDVTGNTTVTGTLGVSGATSLGGAVEIVGSTRTNSNIVVSGTLSAVSGGYIGNDSADAARLYLLSKEGGSLGTSYWAMHNYRGAFRAFKGEESSVWLSVSGSTKNAANYKMNINRGASYGTYDTTLYVGGDISASSAITSATTLTGISAVVSRGTLSVRDSASFLSEVVLADNKSISFGGSVGKKLDLYNNAYKIGIESNTLAYDADTMQPTSMHLFRTGGSERLRVSQFITASADMQAKDVQSNGFSALDPIRGYQITEEGVGTFNTLYATQMHVKAFIADIEQALAGSQIIAKSVARLASDVSIDDSAPFTITVDSFEGYPSMNVFVIGDVLRLRAMTRTSSSLDISDTWVTITTGSSFSDNGKRQTWTVELASGAVSTYRSGSLVLDYGTPGCGVIETSAVSSSGGAGMPYQQITTWDIAPYADQRLVYRHGDLKGVQSPVFGTLNGIGMYASGSVFLEGGINATRGQIGGFAINNTTISSSNNALVLRSSGDITGSQVQFTGGNIGGFTITSNAISSSNNALVLRSSGDITGSQVLFSGGKIADWSIDSSKIQKSVIIAGAGGTNQNHVVRLATTVADASSGTERGNCLGLNIWNDWSNGTAYVISVGRGMVTSNDSDWTAPTANGGAFTRTTDREGFQFINYQDNADRIIFEVSAQSGVTGGALKAVLGGWKFDYTKLWKSYNPMQDVYYAMALNSSNATIDFAYSSTEFTSFPATPNVRLGISYDAASTYSLEMTYATSFRNGAFPTNTGDYATAMFKSELRATRIYSTNTLAKLGVDVANNTGRDANGRTPFVQLSRHNGSNDSTWYMVVETTGDLAIYEGSTIRAHITKGSNGWVSG